MRTLRCFAPAFLLAAFSVTNALSAGNAPTVINPNFSNVAIQCGNGYAYESYLIGNCSAPTGPTQQFNGAVGQRWLFSPQNAATGHGTGLTAPNSNFNPPSFAGLPFSQAAFLQDANSKITQTISGFVAGQQYTLSFYLGSRYFSGTINGDQVVVAMIDNQVVGTWTLISYTPFIIRTATFIVPTSGTHTLKLIGALPGDHTAFVSGVRITQ